MSPARLQYMAFAQYLAFGLGLAGFAGLLLAGLYRNVVLEQRAPPLSNEYGGYVNELAASEDWDHFVVDAFIWRLRPGTDNRRIVEAGAQ